MKIYAKCIKDFNYREIITRSVSSKISDIFTSHRVKSFLDILEIIDIESISNITLKKGDIYNIERVTYWDCSIDSIVVGGLNFGDSYDKIKSFSLSEYFVIVKHEDIIDNLIEDIVQIKKPSN